MWGFPLLASSSWTRWCLLAVYGCWFFFFDSSLFQDKFLPLMCFYPFFFFSFFMQYALFWLVGRLFEIPLPFGFCNAVLYNLTWIDRWYRAPCQSLPFSRSFFGFRGGKNVCEPPPPPPPGMVSPFSPQSAVLRQWIFAMIPLFFFLLNKPTLLRDIADLFFSSSSLEGFFYAPW